MLNELATIWNQLVETYEALEAVLDEIPDARLDWRPAPEATTASEIIQHIARANITYANIMQTGESGVRPQIQPGLARQAIVERVRTSHDRVRDVYESLPLDRLHAPCADDWAPFGPSVPGPLDALWFAHLMLRHTAYHVGQLNYIVLLNSGV
jgi:hypothetical protein